MEALFKEEGTTGRTAIKAGIVSLMILGLASAAVSASSGSDNRTGPGAQPLLASPSAAASLTPAASPTPSPVVPTGTGSWAINGGTLKAGGAMAAELDTGGNAFSAIVAATKGAWSTQFAVTGQGPVTIQGTISGPGPKIDATVNAVGFPVQVHGTPGKDLSVTLGSRTSSTFVPAAYVQQRGDLNAAGITAQGFDTTASELGQGWLRTVVIFTLIGWVALLIAPGLRGRGRLSVHTSPWRRLGLGLILVLDIPLAMLLLLVLGVPLGVWWLGIVGLVLFIALCVVSYAYAGFQIGALVIDRVWDAREAWLAAVPFGVAVLALIALVPYAGPISIIVAVVYGLGSMLYAPAEPVPAQLVAPTQAAVLPAATTSSAPASKPVVE